MAEQSDRAPISRRVAEAVRALRGSRLELSTVVAYSGAIVAAELCVAFVRVDVGVAVHALVLLALVNHHIVLTAREAPSSTTQRRHDPDVVLALALVPLLRILSLTMPVAELSPPYAYVFVGAPLLLGVALAARAASSFQLWTMFARFPGQGLATLSGIPLGLAAYLIVRPEPVGGGWVAVLVACVGVVLFSAAVEELLFRGLLQNVLYAAFGWGGMLVSPMLYAAVYLAASPLGYAAFAAATGLLFTWLAYRTRSLVGVVGSHAVMNLSAVVIWPWLIG